MKRGALVHMAGGGDAEDAVKQIYIEQLGREPDEAGLNFYKNELSSGSKTPQRIAEEIDRSTEGYNYDVQNVVSAYRKNFGRDPDQAGAQYWLGKEDVELKNSKELADAIKGGAAGVDVEAIKNNPQGFLNITSEALRADPYSGMYAVDNPYIFDEPVSSTGKKTKTAIEKAKATPNVSQTAAGQYIQFVNPITEQPAYSGYTPDGKFKVFAGNDVLQPDRVRQAVNLAQESGALGKKDADKILQAISSPEQFRAITGSKDPKANTLYSLLANPKASVVLDTLGVQVGEDADASLAMAESAARQKIVDKARLTTGKNINPSTLLQEEVAKELGIKFPFTQKNLTIDPLTGKPIRTFMTADDIKNNLFTQLQIPIDQELKNIFTSGLGFYNPNTVQPDQVKPPPPPDVVGTVGDFRGLAFPQERPTTIGETPAMLGFQPYTITQAGSGQQKTTEPQPFIPTSNSTVDPLTGALLGSVISSFLPGAQNNTFSAIGDILGGATKVASQGFSDVGGGIKNILSKNGGLATPLMKEGGMVPHFADGGFSQITSGLDTLLGSTPVRGALFGALISQLLNAQAQSQAANAYKGIDMSKVGVIPPRTTMVGPARFAPYRQYASLPEIPSAVSSPINVGALRASQTPMTSFTPTEGMVNPLARPLNTIMPTPMADGGAAYYTYGQSVDPLDYLGNENGMAYGGLAHGGVHHADNAPIVQGRKDYRQGSAVTGPGDGQSDDIPAMLADGEYVFDADTVAQLGNGSTKAGSQMLDKFREEIRQHKRSAPVNKIPPPSKSPLAYLAAAQKKMKGASRA
jgi:hypothetical protein